MRSKVKVDPSEVYAPLKPFTHPEGIVGVNDRLRGAAPVVQKYPERFILASATPAEALAAASPTSPGGLRRSRRRCAPFHDEDGNIRYYGTAITLVSNGDDDVA